MSTKQKILIVDDEPRNQRIIAETLEDLAELELASTGEEALACAAKSAPDLVLLDIMMPGIDGYEVCRRLRADARLTLTKIILVSGKAMIDERLKGYEAGADDYMTKPFASEELLAKTRVFLRLTLAEKQLSEMNRSLDQQVQDRTRQLLDAEAKLVNTAKMSALGEMAGGIAHEINTPLATIGMIAEQLQELIQEEPLDRKAALEMTALATSTVHRIGRIIHGLRTFSRDGSQDGFQRTTLDEIFESTLVLCREKLKNGGIAVHVDVPKGPNGLQLDCRAVQICQVLLNLIGNSCDAIQGSKDKWIRIAADRPQEHPGMIRISVTDNGGGLPEEVRQRIFQPFFTTKEIGKGTGLGLSISKGLIDAHGGTLSVDADCPNTRFVLLVPETHEITQMVAA